MGKKQSKPLTLLDKPWKESKWGESVRQELWNEVACLAPETRGELEVPFFNILLTGQIKAGKSSFYNSLNSVLLKRIHQRAEVGNVGKSLTREFHIYEVRTDSKSPPLSWRICDTMGLTYEANDESDVRNILKAVDGHVPSGYEFKENKEFDEDNKKYISKPCIADKAHCVAVVVDASALTVMHPGMWEKLRKLRENLIDKKVPTFIILTHIDKACTEVGKDVTKVFHSIQIRDHVISVGKNLLGLPENQIFPVKNYSMGNDLNNDTDILLLYALRQMLYAAQGHLENQIDKKKYCFDQ